jgi:hypothetical protein
VQTLNDQIVIDIYINYTPLLNTVNKSNMKYVKQIDLQCEKHKLEIINIISGKNSLMRQSADMSCKAVDKYNNFIKYNSILFGYYDDEKLISFLTSTPWEGLPYYTISNFFVLHGHIKYFTLVNSGMIDLLTETVKYMENKNYYTFYYARSEDHWPIKTKKRKIKEKTSQKSAASHANSF